MRTIIALVASIAILGTAAPADAQPEPAPEESPSSEPALEESPSSEEEPFQLKVALYPWLPDADSFMKWIEKDFEEKHSDVDLVVRPVAMANDVAYGDLAYEFEKTTDALKNEDSLDFQHLVEIDTVILGKLIENQAIQPFGVESGVSFLPAAIEAVTSEDTVYGVPHWTCGYFVISRLEEVRQARNLSQLLSILDAAGTSAVDLVGDLDGSWDSNLIYLDAIEDSFPEARWADFLDSNHANNGLDPSVMQGFERIGAACSAGGSNNCSGDGDYVEMFASNGADALIGYSERLNKILTDEAVRPDDLYVASATLGNGDHPTLFTDALVLSRTCETERCRGAASAFAAYSISDEVFETVLMNHDSKSDEDQMPTPRYLLPSTTTAFDVGDVGNDRLYRQLKEEVDGARSHPNRGVPEARDRDQRGLPSIRSNLRQALGL